MLKKDCSLIDYSIHFGSRRVKWNSSAQQSREPQETPDEEIDIETPTTTLPKVIRLSSFFHEWTVSKESLV